MVYFMENPWKQRMIWGYLYFRKPPFIETFQVQFQSLCSLFTWTLWYYTWWFGVGESSQNWTISGLLREIDQQQYFEPQHHVIIWIYPAVNPNYIKLLNCIELYWITTVPYCTYLSAVNYGNDQQSHPPGAFLSLLGLRCGLDQQRCAGGRLRNGNGTHWPLRMNRSKTKGWLLWSYWIYLVLK